MIVIIVTSEAVDPLKRKRPREAGWARPGRSRSRGSLRREAAVEDGL